MGDTIQVVVAYAPAPREVIERAVELRDGATVQDALQASGLTQDYPGIGDGEGMLGVWGRKAEPGQVLKDRDRVEIYRPLRVDPKVARRERFNAQGARAAGLFARRRPGAKPGY